MAEPLTSSDIWRKERGWGASEFATEEDRKRLAAAGELPISSGDFERLVEGRGISPSASRDEKEAWVASEVMLGLRDPMDLPKTYGGLGERPKLPKTAFFSTGELTGSGRRAIRMQEEWDAQRAAMLEEQKMVQEMESERKDYELRLQSEQRLQDQQRLSQLREEEVQNQARRAMESVMGATLPDGQRIRPININDDDAVERLQSVIYSNSLGMENQATKEAITMMLNDALSIRERKLQESKQQESVAAKLSAEAGVPMQELGEYTEAGLFKPNLNAIVKVNEELKKKEEAAAEEKEIEKETRVAEARETAAEKRSKERQIVDIDKDLRREGLALEEVAASLGLQRDQSGRFNIGGLSDTQKKTFRAAENRVRLLEQDKAQLQGFMFDTEADAQAAIEAKRVPKGAIIFINGKKAINR